MNMAPTKHCGRCQKDYPATTDYFYPSHLTGRGRNQCKKCHQEHQKKNPEKRRVIREKLIEIAQPVEQNQRSSYWTFNTIATRVGCTRWVVANDIYTSKKSVFKFHHNQRGISLALTKEDAEAYITSKKQQPDQMTADPDSIEKKSTRSVASRPAIGTPSQCGACKTTEGNIICDVDPITKAWRGYLCAPCYRLARLIRDYLQGDPQRLHPVLTYIKRLSK
jgi:hypothetical protein